MKKLIFVVVILAFLVVGLTIGVPFVKYKSLDKVVTFWSEALGGTSSFNPGKGWQDLKATGTGVQREVAQTPGAQQLGDLVAVVWGEFQKGFTKFWGTQLGFTKDWPVFSNLTVGSAIIIFLLILGTILFLLWMTALFGKGAKKVAPDQILLGQKAIAGVRKDSWRKTLRWGAVIILLIGSMIDLNKKEFNLSGLPLFVVPIAIVYIITRLAKLFEDKDFPLVKIEDLVWIATIITLVILLSMIFGAIPGISVPIDKLVNLVGSIPAIGWFLRDIMSGGVNIGRASPSFTWGLLSAVILFIDHHVEKEIRPAVTTSM